MRNSRFSFNKISLFFVLAIQLWAQMGYSREIPPVPASGPYCSDNLKEICANIGPKDSFNSDEDIQLTVQFDTILQKPIENVSAYLYNSEHDLLVFDVSVVKVSDKEFTVSSNPLFVPGDWELRLEFDHGLFYQIFIPLKVLP